MATISATGLQSLVEAAKSGHAFTPMAVSVCRMPTFGGPVPMPYPNASSTTATTTSTADPAAQKGVVTRECWAAALEGAVARAYRTQLFDLDSQMRSLWTILEEIRRNRAALDASQIESRRSNAMSNIQKMRHDLSMNAITNFR